MGTANNIARVLGLPLDLEGAMNVIAQGNVKSIDVGRVSGQYFLEAAGVGLFADAFAAFGKDEPRKWQVIRLLKVLGPMLWNPPIRNLELKLDGVAEKDAAIWIAVSNSAYIGDNMRLAPDASLEDGQFDVIIVGAMDRIELLHFGLALARGKHLGLPKVRGARAKAISIERVHRGHRALPVHADAEIVGFTPTLLETVPGAIQVFAP
jgi:diacylglycerol kinase family enzyme